MLTQRYLFDIDKDSFQKILNELGNVTDYDSLSVTCKSIRAIMEKCQLTVMVKQTNSIKYLPYHEAFQFVTLQRKKDKHQHDKDFAYNPKNYSRLTGGIGLGIIGVGIAMFYTLFMIYYNQDQLSVTTKWNNRQDPLYDELGPWVFALMGSIAMAAIYFDLDRLIFGDFHEIGNSGERMFIGSPAAPLVGLLLTIAALLVRPFVLLQLNSSSTSEHSLAGSSFYQTGGDNSVVANGGAGFLLAGTAGFFYINHRANRHRAARDLDNRLQDQMNTLISSRRC
jgi:hypothetical protein